MEQQEPLLEVEVQSRKKERRINPSFLNSFVDKINIVDVAKSLGLKMRTNNSDNYYYCLCFLHKQNTPSPTLIMSHAIQRYHCYGCGKSGDVISLVMEKTGKNFIESIFYIKKVCGVKEKIKFENILIKERIAYLLSDFNKSEEVFEEKQEILESDDCYLRYLDEGEK